jgi:asparagine synthase (glutamine-hydrolysing)
VADRLTDRLTTLAASRPIALAFNGDLSSQLVLALLRRVGYPEVFCWTYGHPRSSHVALSKEVAQQLACPWFFVDSRRFRADKLIEASGQQFLRAAHRGAFVPQLAPFLALQALCADPSFNSQVLMIWGGWGEEITGINLPTGEIAQHYGLTHAGVLARLLDQLRNGQARKHLPCNEEVQQLALQQLMAWGSLESPRDWLALLETWLLAGPSSLKALSMARAAEHFGFDWMPPLADAEWLQFWFDVPNSFRAEQALFHKWLNVRFGRPMGLAFEGRRRATNRLWRWMYRLRSQQVPSNSVDLTPLALQLAEATGTPFRSLKHRPSEEQILAAWLLQQYGYSLPVSEAL